MFWLQRNLDKSTVRRNSSLHQSLNIADVETATVTRLILPDRVGQVSFKGSWWSARCLDPISIQPDALVEICDRVNATTLLVKPIANLTHID